MSRIINVEEKGVLTLLEITDTIQSSLQSLFSTSVKERSSVGSDGYTPTEKDFETSFYVSRFKYLTREKGGFPDFCFYNETKTHDRIVDYLNSFNDNEFSILETVMVTVKSHGEGYKIQFSSEINWDSPMHSNNEDAIRRTSSEYITEGEYISLKKIKLHIEFVSKILIIQQEGS